MALRLQTFAKLFRINGIRSMSSVGDFGSGAGKGGGAGGTIREAGGSFGKMEAAHEEQYIKRLIFYRHSQLSSDKFVVSLDGSLLPQSCNLCSFFVCLLCHILFPLTQQQEQLQELKKHMQEEMKYHDQQIAQHKQAEQLKKLKDHLDEEVEHHEHSIKQHQEAIERHKKRIHDLEKTDKGSDSD